MGLYILLLVILVLQFYVFQKASDIDKKVSKLNEFVDQIRRSQAENDAAFEDDPLYEDAKKLVIDSGKASASFIQRKFRIGYSRSARLLDQLEQNGIVGPAEGSTPREVFKSDTQ